MYSFRRTKRLKTPTNLAKPRPKAGKSNRLCNDKGLHERGWLPRKGRFYAHLDANNGRQYNYPFGHASTVARHN